MRYNHIAAIVAICLIQIVSLKAKSKHHILRNKTKRSNNGYIPMIENPTETVNANKRTIYTENDANTLSYHRSFVPDMSFTSQVEEMPTEENIALPVTNELNQNMKKDTVSRALEQYINSDLNNLNQPTGSDYSGWSNQEQQLQNNINQSIPTSVPASIPTALPAPIPTTLPASVSTALPAPIPTTLPASVPTTLPAPIPTILPASVHTSLSAPIPTTLPASAPTNFATATPTNIPSINPTATPTNTPTYPAKNITLNIPSSNSLHISQFSCLRIQMIMCMYEQVSILCPSKCHNHNGSHNETDNNNTSTTTVSPSEGNNSTDLATTTTPTPTDKNTTPSTNNTIDQFGQQERLIHVYMKYDEKVFVDKYISGDTNNINSQNNDTSNETNSDEVGAPLNITTPSQLEELNNKYETSKNSTLYDASLEPSTNNQADGRTITAVDPHTSSYEVSPNNESDQIHDLLNDSFYILAGAVDRTTKGFYLTNMMKPNFTLPDNETIPDKNTTTNATDPEECAKYTINDCAKHNISKLCPYLCGTCTQWFPTTECSTKCGAGFQNKTRECKFPNNTIITETAAFPCNYMPCNATCKILTEWGDCLKDTDGVSVRAKNCTLADGTSHIYYEHRACNDINTNKPLNKRRHPLNKDQDNNNKENNKHMNHNRDMAAYISFDKFRDDINVVYDEQVNSNDLNVLNIKLFDGNFTCGFGALLTQHDSIMIFNDNVFRNFQNNTFSILVWVFPKSGAKHEGSRPQTIFQFISNDNRFGAHMLELANDTTLEWTHYNSEGQRVFSKKTTMKITMDRWVHIGLVYRSQPQIAAIYIDSIPSTLDNHAVYQPLINTKITRKNVGTFQAIGNDINLNKPFYGVFDEIFIFEKPIHPTMITEIADTCRYRVGRGCPSPLLGYCPDCPSCTTQEVLSRDKNFDDEHNTPYTPINPPVIS